MKLPRRLNDDDKPDFEQRSADLLAHIEASRREAIQWIRHLEKAALAIRQRRGDPWKEKVTEDELELMTETRIQNLGVKGTVLWLLAKRRWTRHELAAFVVEALRGEIDTTYQSVLVTIGSGLRSDLIVREYIDGTEYLSCPTTK